MAKKSASAKLPSVDDAGADPIFAAIERHKASYAAFSHVLTLKDDFEQQHEDETPEPEQAEWDRREEETCTAEVDACDEMIATGPTTLPGLLALLRYIKREVNRGDVVLEQDGLEKLLSSTISVLVAIGGVS
jgi:hypothetical protein